jgi:hypothetical protein
MLIAHNTEQANMVGLINSYLQGRKGPSLGSKTEQARNEGKADGFRDGVAEALAVWLTIKRREQLHHTRYVEAVSDLDVKATLAPFAEEYFTVRNTPKKKVNSGSAEPSAFDMFLLDAYKALLDLVVTPEMVEADAAVRRELVLKGEAQPTEDDRLWLADLKTERLAEARKLDSIIANLDNTGR